MLLWTVLIIAIIAGLLQPFASRLHATGLWAGKALVPPEAASAYPRGVQDALTDGWPSTFCFTVSLTPYLDAIIGFFYSWWAGIVAFLTAVFVQSIAGRTSIASKSVDRYLAVLMDHAARRAANYAAKGDTQRSEAAHDLAQQLAGLLEIYLNSGIPSPTVKESRRAPHGEPEHLYRLYVYSIVPDLDHRLARIKRKEQSKPPRASELEPAELKSLDPAVQERLDQAIQELRAIAEKRRQANEDSK